MTTEWNCPSCLSKMAFLAAFLAMLSACVSAGVPDSGRTVARPAPTQAAAAYSTRGLEAVMGQSADRLTRLFGDPRLDLYEGEARKLQFSGAECVLDAYLYSQGGGERVVTHVDARTPDGRTADRASCVAALSR